MPRRGNVMRGKLYREATALALVGWYLMMPPWVAPNTFDANAPVSKWRHASSYDSVTQCEGDRNFRAEYASTHPETKDSDWFMRLSDWFTRLYAASQCIATDDPRL